MIIVAAAFVRLAAINKNMYWNLRLSDKAWVSAGKYSDLEIRYTWRQAPKVLP